MLETVFFDNVNLRSFEETPPKGTLSEVWKTDVCFEKGRSYLIEAASGRGKSSFCAFLYGLRNDYVGEIRLKYDGGESVTAKEADFVSLRQNSLAMMFQELRLFPELNAVDNVMLKNSLTGYATEKDVRSMLIKLGLEQHLGRPCVKLSFGQQQRVAFVRALCQPADFIILDEPVSHLDETNASIMARMLRERQRTDNIGVIVTSIGYRLPYEYDKVLSL